MFRIDHLDGEDDALGGPDPQKRPLVIRVGWFFVFPLIGYVGPIFVNIKTFARYDNHITVSVVYTIFGRPYGSIIEFTAFISYPFVLLVEFRFGPKDDGLILIWCQEIFDAFFDMTSIFGGNKRVVHSMVSDLPGLEADVGIPGVNSGNFQMIIIRYGGFSIVFNLHQRLLISFLFAAGSTDEGIGDGGQIAEIGKGADTPQDAIFG